MVFVGNAVLGLHFVLVFMAVSNGFILFNRW